MSKTYSSAFTSARVSSSILTAIEDACPTVYPLLIRLYNYEIHLNKDHLFLPLRMSFFAREISKDANHNISPSFHDYKTSIYGNFKPLIFIPIMVDLTMCEYIPKIETLSFWLVLHLIFLTLHSSWLSAF